MEQVNNNNGRIVNDPKTIEKYRKCRESSDYDNNRDWTPLSNKKVQIIASIRWEGDRKIIETNSQEVVEGLKGKTDIPVFFNQTMER